MPIDIDIDGFRSAPIVISPSTPPPWPRFDELNKRGRIHPVREESANPAAAALATAACGSRSTVPLPWMAAAGRGGSSAVGSAVGSPINLTPARIGQANEPTSPSPIPDQSANPAADLAPRPSPLAACGSRSTVHFLGGWWRDGWSSAGVGGWLAQYRRRTGLWGAVNGAVVWRGIANSTTHRGHSHPLSA